MIALLFAALLTRAAAGAEASDDTSLAARALQRSLVQRGALLLPIWGVEVVPSLTYSHSSDDTLLTVLSADSTSARAVSLRRRSHQLTGALTSRLGLPWDLQIEASVPVVRTWTHALVSGIPAHAFASGFGDPRFGITRQLLRERNATPDLLATATWKPSTSEKIGTGFTQLGATLTASKSSEPLVLVTNFSITVGMAADSPLGRRDPGDLWNLGGGALLAANPETSMSFMFDLYYKPNDRLDGRTFEGSDETIVFLQLGLARTLSDSALLNILLAIGATADSPDVRLGISLPLRF